MKSCAVGSSIGGLALAVVLAIGACRSTPSRVDVPPVTSAAPNAAVPLMSDGPKDAAVEAAVPVEPPAVVPSATNEAAPKASLHETPFRLEDGVCERAIVAVAKGSFSVAGETLAAGDVLVVADPEGSEVKGSGLAVEARVRIPTCVAKARPAPERTVIRANVAPKLEWAGGKMSARLDVSTKASPEIYLGRLEGTGAVAEHVHAGSWEVLAAIDAAGTFTLDGKDQRLGPRQVVFVPPNTKHAWKPDPGSKLVAIQMYSPPGPEQRFVALAAAEKDALKDAGSR